MKRRIDKGVEIMGNLNRVNWRKALFVWCVVYLVCYAFFYTDSNQYAALQSVITSAALTFGFIFLGFVVLYEQWHKKNEDEKWEQLD